MVNLTHSAQGTSLRINGEVLRAKQLYAELEDERLPALWQAIQNYLKTQMAEATSHILGT